MRATNLNTVCILALNSILVIGLEAHAQLDPNMEAGVACSSSDCMFRGNPQTRDAVASFSKLPTGARLQKINNYADNGNTVVDRGVETQLSPIGELMSVREVTEKGEIKTDRKVSKTGETHHLQGSAFLVSPCYILTAAHVVFGEGQLPKDGVDYTMNFSIGKGEKGPFAGSFAATPDLSLTSITRQTDWTLLKLPEDKCMGAHPAVGYYEASKKEVAVGDAMVAAGYGSDHARGELALGAGSVRGTDANGQLLFSGSFVKGASGGPALTVDEDGVTRVAGLVTSEMDTNGTQLYATYSDANANKIQSISSILNNPAVKAALDADKARFGNKNPAMERLTRPLPSFPVAARKIAPATT